MSRKAAWTSCAACLILGLVLGATGEWRFGNRLHADPVEPSAEENDLRELQSTRSALQDAGETLAKIARLTTNSVVHIECVHKTPRGRGVEETGSGVIVESTKTGGFYVVSNYHVVDGLEKKPDQISIHLHDGRVIHPTDVKFDKATDVAIMSVKPANLQALRWGDSDQLEIGHMVLAVGSPFGLSQSVTLGIISGKGRRSLKMPDSSEMINQDFLQTDAAINPGNSGGPLINMRGQIVGINTAIASQSGGNEGIGFSIPSNLVHRIIDQLLTTGKVTRAYLGVSLDDDFTVQEAASLKLDRLRGARVVDIHANSPATRADLRKDDVILTFDGIEVQDESHLINLVSLTEVNKKVKLVVYRAGKHITVEVIVGDRKTLDDARKLRSEAPAEPGMGTQLDQLGLTVHELDDELAMQLGFDESTRGLLVLKVNRDGPMAGTIKLYDLIEEVSRKPIHSVEELKAALKTVEDTDTVLMTIKRRSAGKIESQAVVFRPE